MLRSALALSFVSAVLTAAVAAGIGGNILPARAMPVLLAGWSASLVICAVLWALRWAVRMLLGDLTAVRDLSKVVAKDLTRRAGSPQEESLRPAR